MHHLIFQKRQDFSLSTKPTKNIQQFVLVHLSAYSSINRKLAQQNNAISIKMYFL